MNAHIFLYNGISISIFIYQKVKQSAMISLTIENDFRWYGLLPESISMLRFIVEHLENTLSTVISQRTFIWTP
jgi:hypothetical protein